MKRVSIAIKVIGAVTVVGLTIGFLLVERLPEYVGTLPEQTAAQTIVGKVTRVRDGDTIEVEGHPIRFGSLDCDERGSSRGDAATNRMRSLISGQILTCYLNGRTSYDRSIGSCTLSDGRDIGAVMIQEGQCGRFF